MKTEKSYWSTLCERIVRKAASSQQPAEMPERPAMDVDENDKVLAGLGEGDPAYRVVLNYAYVHVENNLAVAFDVAKSVDEQRDFKNRAAGVAALIADVEETRARLKAERSAQQKLEANKKK